MITLYGSMQSRANRCAWMLKELNAEFNLNPVNFQDGSTREPGFLSVNPNGRVPVIDHDGFILFESLAINLYLCKKHGGLLAPKNLEEDALMMQWSFWAVTEIEKTLLLACANNYLFAEALRNEQERDIAMIKLSRPFQVLEEHLQQKSFILGDRFSAADLNVASVLSLIPVSKIDLSPWPTMAAWLKTCLDRPAAQDWKDVSFQIPRPDSTLGMLAMFV